jgi:KamA family protein
MISDRIPITAPEVAQDEAHAASDMAYRVTRFYSEQIRRSARYEQLKRIVEPSPEERQNAGHWDTSGESQNTVMPGLQHKYPQTAVILTTVECFAHCRFCFRKRLHGADSNEIAADYPAIARYIRNHPEVNNVLLTGGDAFMLDTEALRAIVEPLLDIPHLTAIRFGSRALVYYPPRFRERNLIALFEQIIGARKRAIIVSQIDDGDELSDEAVTALAALRRAGVRLLNQAVLLKGVNDDADGLAATFEKLHRLGVDPYYLFQARPVVSALHFQVDLRRGVEIVHAVNRRLCGIQKTFRYVMSHTTGKIEILDLGPDNRLYLRYHQCKNPEKIGRVFSLPFREGECWLDDILSE